MFAKFVEIDHNHTLSKHTQVLFARLTAIYH